MTKQKLKVQNLHLDQPQQVQLEPQHHLTKFQPQQPLKVQKKKKIHNLHKMWLNLLQDLTQFRFRFPYLL